MSHGYNDYQAVAWLKQRLEDLDTIIHAGEGAAVTIEGEARLRADAALERLKASRSKLEALREELRDRLVDTASDAKARGEQAMQRLEDEWVEVETAYQDFISGLREIGDFAYEATQALLAVRATAQHKAWAASLAEARALAADAIEGAEEEFRSTVQLIESQFESLKSRTLKVGDAAWDSLSEAVSKARQAQEQALKKVKDALAKVV